MTATKIRMIDIMQFLTTGDVNITKKYGVPQAELKSIKHSLREGRWKVVERMYNRRRQRNAG